MGESTTFDRTKLSAHGVFSSRHATYIVRGRQADGHAAVRDRKCAHPEACPNGRANSSTSGKCNAVGGFWAGHVPDRRQRHPFDWRPVHGAIGLVGNRGAAGVPDRHRAGYRPDPFGNYHGRQHGNWNDHTASWVEPVRDLRCSWHADDERGACRITVPCCALCVPNSCDLCAMDFDLLAQYVYGA